MQFGQPVTDIIKQRFSCRTYLDVPIENEKQQELAHLLLSLQAGPFGTRARFKLLAATEQDRSELRGLGTYGFIKNPPGFIVGAVRPAEKNLEDCGYQMERIVLQATDWRLGTCWLGGTFTKSSFSRGIGARGEETVPAVVSIGYMAGEELPGNPTPARASQTGRLPWEALFFDVRFGAALSREQAGAYATPLEMVRLAPSASNKQPWRIVRAGDAWHFYMQRTFGYRTMRLARLVQIADMQRLDMGIAMCHFELTAREAGLAGRWQVNDPGAAKPDALTEYVVSWVL